MTKEMKKFMKEEMIMDVTNGKMTFVNRIPEVFIFRIEDVQIDNDDQKKM